MSVPPIRALRRSFAFVAAHYTYDPKIVDGIIFPHLRRVVRRTPEGPLINGRTSFMLDYTELRVRDR